jgi:hypothetical protein
MLAKITDGVVNLTPEEYWENKMLIAAAEAYAIRLADQHALSKCYTIDELAGPDGRLKRTRSTIEKAISDGRLRVSPVGESKGYVVTELAVREFLGDITR